MSGEITSEQEFKIGHVLFIDIVGYSKLSIEEQREAVERLSQIVRETEQFCVAGEAGQLVSLPAGDGMALVFSTTVEAPVHCALEIARKLKSHADLPVRMGIHSGPVSDVRDVNEQSNIAGAGINMAQRVMERGDAGHILLSKHVADDLEQYRNWRSHLHDLGECEVKHGKKLEVVNLYNTEVGNPEVPTKFRPTKDIQTGSVLGAKRAPRMRILIVAFMVVAGAAIGGFYFFPHRAASTNAISEKSIAVLPFENRSAENANAYFADGIQDEILTRLSKIADLKVISRTSTQHYKSAPTNLPQIAMQLGVTHILEGSVQKSGDTVRVNVQLIKAANDSHLWADTFDRKLTDIFSVESEVARAIAEQLQAKLTGQEQQVITAKPTQNIEAYDAYLRGLAYTLKTFPTRANAIGAQKYFKEAVRLDPKFALSWSLLSIVEARGYITQSLPPTILLRDEARQAATTAWTLQPYLGEAILAMGCYHYACLKDYDAAVCYFEQARQSLPNNSRIPEWLAYVARRRGQWHQSKTYFDEAARLDPRNVSLLTQHATTDIALRDFANALRKFDEGLDITPDDPDILVQKAAIAQAEGDLPHAAALLAPFHFGADVPENVETQVYQALLERRPAQIIPQLEETLANPDPALGYFNGELRFWLGWAQEAAGDYASAKATWQLARNELEPILKEQPDDYVIIKDLALINMGLGDKSAALALAKRAIAANPIENDALTGPSSTEVMARVAAGVAEPDLAIAALRKLLSIPYFGALGVGMPLTPALVRLDPMFDQLRTDARFQELLAWPAPKVTTPNF